MFVPGRHGSMPSSEFETFLVRNTEFCTVIRSGSGDGVAGVCSSITGETIRGIGGGRIPEYSYMRDETPRLVRGWRNICYELLAMRNLRITKEVKTLLGRRFVFEAYDYGMRGALESPEPSKIWVDSHGTRGYSGADRMDPYR